MKKGTLAHCEPMAHEWEVEEAIGNFKHSPSFGESVILSFRCKKCNASLKGEVKR